MALKVPGGRNGSNSSPYPKVPDAGNTGWLSSRTPPGEVISTERLTREGSPVPVPEAALSELRVFPVAPEQRHRAASRGPLRGVQWGSNLRCLHRLRMFLRRSS